MQHTAVGNIVIVKVNLAANVADGQVIPAKPVFNLFPVTMLVLFYDVKSRMVKHAE